eukprot:TRINITY_DN4308_c0_g1_i4.p1 TRINITY_DN4308_c0_g1~~TRINITY_DN4308_c0_g1_i4.p1  ORF type:complete len:215 (+),score=6.44 TRINITY_DN4308_c0_g1_i4:135-779(+)
MSGQADNAVQVANQLQNDGIANVSASTVRRTLRQLGMRAVIKKKRARLLPRHKRDRLNFARRYQHWTADDWKCVIWSDETKINRIASDGRQWVWSMPAEALSSRKCQETVKFGGANVMVWGCMTAYAVGYATRIDGGLDGPLYVKILDDELQQTIDYYQLDGQNIVFQHDNDPKTPQTWPHNGSEIRQLRCYSGQHNGPTSIPSNTYGLTSSNA